MHRSARLLALVAALAAPSASAQGPRLPAGLLPVPEADRAVRSPVERPVDVLGETDEAYGALFNFGSADLRLARFAVANAAAVTALLALSASSYAGEWVPDAAGGPGFLYEMALVGATWYVLRRNLTTYAAETLAEAPLPAGVGWTGLAYSAALGALYAIATNCAGLNYLYLVNLQNGAQTLLATFVTAVCLVSFAIGNQGYGLALDTELDRLFLINLVALTAVALAQGIGYDTGFAQGMGFSHRLAQFFLGTIRVATALEAGLPAGELRSVDTDGTGMPTGSTTFLGEIGNGSEEALYLTFIGPPGTAAEPRPATYELSAVYPNPFAPEAALTLRLDRAEHVRVEVLDALGRRVALLHDGAVPGGEPRTFRLDRRGLAPGAYLVLVTGASFRATRPATLAR